MSAQKLGYNLERIEDGEEARIACRNCGEDICEAGQNYKKHVLCEVMPMEEAGPLMNDPSEYVDDEVEFREYYCPGCARRLETEVILAELGPIHDRELK